MRRAISISLLALCAFACAELGDDSLYEAEFEEGGSGGSGGNGGGATFAAVQQIFSQRCTTAGCHGTVANSTDLVLTEGESYASLLGEDGQGNVPTQHLRCAGTAMVTPGEPDRSCLWIRVRDGDMPPGGLPQPMRETIRSWIAAGAPPPE